MVSATFDNEALLNALKQFPINIQKNVMTGAIRAGANVIRDEARKRVAKRTRNLEKSIKTIKRKAERNQIKFTVTPAKGRSEKYDGWYAHFIEFGTVNQPAQPFMRPAFEQSNNESLNAAKKYIADRIPKEVEKAKK